jgi:hypothetical protein
MSSCVWFAVPSIEWKLSREATELSSISMVSRHSGKVPFQNELDEQLSADRVFASSLSNQQCHYLHVLIFDTATGEPFKAISWLPLCPFLATCPFMILVGSMHMHAHS